MERARVETDGDSVMPRRLPHNRGPIIAPEADLAYAIADKYVPSYQRVWLREIRKVGRIIGDVARVTLREYYEVEATMRAIDISPDIQQAWSDMVDELVDPMMLVWNESSKEASVGDIMTIVKRKRIEAEYSEFFGKPEQMHEALDFAKERSSTHVKQIQFNQRDKIRELVADGIENGIHPDIIAQDIVDLGIGLPDRGPYTYKRVERYRAGLVDAGVTGKDLEKMVKKFHEKMLFERAASIARTEMAEAQAKARRATWRDEQKTGLITSDTVRVWIAGQSARTCAACVGLDGDTAPINGTYKNGMDGPPAHVRCRCTEGLRTKM